MDEVIPRPTEAWEKCEATLDERGTPLPLYHRAIWARSSAASGASCSLVPIRNADGICRAAFALESRPSRALPRHRNISILRLGIGSGGLDEAALDAGLRTVLRYARADRSVLRVHVEAFALESQARLRTSELLARHGFVRVEASRTYERTLVVDLSKSEADLLAGFHKNARQGIRNIARHPVALTVADSVALAPRLQQLSDETRARTQGESRPLDWRSIIRMSTDAPQLSRIAILKRTDQDGPNAVLAFAWGCVHGPVAEYSESGSARPDAMKVSTSYALLWDLMSWARRSGAGIFDLGGITSGGTNSDDPLGGISDFKRRFSQTEVAAGQEWQLEPHPARAVAARIISGSAGFIRSVAVGLAGRWQ